MACQPKPRTHAWAAIFLTVLTLTIAPLSISKAQNIPASDLDPNSELLLAVELNGIPLRQTILAFQKDNELLIAFTELNSLLEFPIDFELDQSAARGWFIEPDRKFELDLLANRVNAGEKTLSVDPQNYYIALGDLFVESKVLELWFPIQFELDLRQLTLRIESQEKLPLQERMERSNRQFSDGPTRSQEARLPLQESPYQAIGHRSTDIRLNYSNTRLDDDSSVQRELNYSLLSTGDLGWMTSRLFLNGSDRDSLTGARLQFERSRFDGPLATNHIELGDINPVSGSGTGRGGLLRGGTAAIDGSRQLGEQTVDLRGDMLPGWEAELYRNGALIDFQVVGDDGQYEFVNVPLVFGENIFRIVMYGPFGEEETVVERRFLSTNTVQAGKFRYELVAMEADTSVFDLEQNNGPGDKGTARILGGLDLGVTDGLSVNLGLDSFEEDQRRFQDYSAGISYNFNVAQASASYRERALQSDSYGFNLSTRLMGLGTSFSHTVFDDSDLAPNEQGTNPLQYQSALNLDYAQSVLPFNLSLDHRQRELSSNSTASLGTTFYAADNLRLSNTLFHELDDQRQNGGQLTQNTIGALSLFTRHEPLTIRAGLNAALHPETRVSSVFLSNRLTIDRSMVMTFDTTYRPDDDFSSFSGGFNWRLGWATLSPRLRYDSEERFYGLVTLSTNITTAPGRYTPMFDDTPQSERSGIYAPVFIDHNASGRFDSNDEALEGVEVLAPQSYRRGISNQNGQTYINRVSAYRQTDVVLDRGTLIDPSLISTDPGVSVRTRPGHWNQVEFPLVRSSELEGYVLQEDSANKTSPVARERVILERDNGEIVAQQISAYDGYFLFSAILPGDYQLRLAQREMIDPIQVSVASDGKIISDLNFRLSPTANRQERSIAPGSFAPVQSEQDRSPTPIEDLGSVDQTESSSSDRPRETMAPAEKTWTVQFGAFGRRPNAIALWEKLKNETPELLADAAPQYLSEAGLTKLLLNTQLTEGEAKDLCEEIEREGLACLVRSTP